MASKAANTAEATETREEAAEAPLLDTVAAAIKKMLARGKERGYLTYDELNAALPHDQVSSEQIEDTMTMLSELGVNLIESEESDEPAPEPEDGDGEVRGNLDDDDIGRITHDDPVIRQVEEPCRALCQHRENFAQRCRLCDLQHIGMKIGHADQ